MSFDTSSEPINDLEKILVLAMSAPRDGLNLNTTI